MDTPGTGTESLLAVIVEVWFTQFPEIEAVSEGVKDGQFGGQPAGAAWILTLAFIAVPFAYPSNGVAWQVQVSPFVVFNPAKTKVVLFVKVVATCAVPFHQMYVKFMLSPSMSVARAVQVMSVPCGAGDGEIETAVEGGVLMTATDAEKFSREYFESHPVSELFCEQLIVSPLFPAPAKERSRVCEVCPEITVPFKNHLQARVFSVSLSISEKEPLLQSKTESV